MSITYKTTFIKRVSYVLVWQAILQIPARQILDDERWSHHHSLLAATQESHEMFTTTIQMIHTVLSEDFRRPCVHSKQTLVALDRLACNQNSLVPYWCHCCCWGTHWLAVVCLMDRQLFLDRSNWGWNLRSGMGTLLDAAAAVLAVPPSMGCEGFPLALPQTVSTYVWWKRVLWCMGMVCGCVLSRVLYC